MLEQQFTAFHNFNFVLPDLIEIQDSFTKYFKYNCRAFDHDSFGNSRKTYFIQTKTKALLVFVRYT